MQNKHLSIFFSERVLTQRPHYAQWAHLLGLVYPSTFSVALVMRETWPDAGGPDAEQTGRISNFTKGGFFDRHVL